MMQEVTITTACEAQFAEQMSEEEILACLVTETKPTLTASKLGESRLEIMDEEEEPLNKYLTENRRLLEASLRLEQENDNLAHRLITSKVALKNALDTAEDNVDELTKELLLTRRQLKASEEEKGGLEEEAAMLKEVLRRELQKAGQEVSTSSSIIAEYKQICSQLTNRLERQQTVHREAFESLQIAVKACPSCRHIVKPDETEAVTEDQGTTDRDKNTTGPTEAEQRREDQEKVSLKAQIRQLEQQLAQTKLQMVEAKCKIQDLEHQKGILANDLQEAKNTWVNKAFTSLRTSSGGLNNLSMSRDGAPPFGRGLQSRSLSGWRLQKLSWPHRHNQEHI